MLSRQDEINKILPKYRDLYRDTIRMTIEHGYLSDEHSKAVDAAYDSYIDLLELGCDITFIGEIHDEIKAEYPGYVDEWEDEEEWE